MPKKPKVVSSEATTGFVKNLTKDSDQFSDVILISAFSYPIEDNSSSKVSFSSSAILYLIANSVVSVISFPSFLPSRSKTSTESPSIVKYVKNRSSSTIPLAISLFLLRLSAVAAISSRI